MEHNTQMSIIVTEQTPSIPSRSGAFNHNTTIAIGDLVMRDVSGSYLTAVENNAQLSTTGSIEGISKTAVATAGGTSISINYIPFVTGQEVIVDCTSNTSSDQLFKRHVLTDGATVANTSTDITTSLGIFMATQVKGAASDKKLVGYFVKLSQVTA